MSEIKHNILLRVDVNHSQQQLEGIINDLELVVSTTEAEVEKILNQVDILNAIAMSSSPQVKEQILTAVQAICEAACFQDINGQRITRVLHSLGKISEYISFMNKKNDDTLKTSDFSFGEKDAAAELLQGPQAPSDESQQDLVDSFFDEQKK